MTKNEFIVKYGEEAYNEKREKNKAWYQANKEAKKLKSSNYYYYKLGVKKEDRIIEKELVKEEKQNIKILKKNLLKIRIEENKLKRKDYYKQKNKVSKYRLYSWRLFKNIFKTTLLDKYEIHHCFGKIANSFCVLLREDHHELHNIFGRNNVDCLYDNTNVRNFINSHPHIIIMNAEITENTIGL